MSKFEKRFFTILEQDDQPTPDAEAMASTLEPGTDPGELGASVDNAAAQAISGREQQQAQQLTDWVTKLEEFMIFLNSTEDGSIQSVLKKSEPDTLLDKVRGTETKKIARTAMDIATLVETFKGYLATSRDPMYRYQ